KVVPATLPDTAAFRDTTSAQPTALYILKNGHAQAAVTNYGARLVSLIVPDKTSNPTDVVVGYDNINSYLHRPDTYFGAIVGRYGNRIAKGHFKLDGKEYTLPTNDGPNTLHGGTKGFDAGIWTGKQLSDRSVQLYYLSTDGEMGFPGNLQVKSPIRSRTATPCGSIMRPRRTRRRCSTSPIIHTSISMARAAAPSTIIY